MTVLIKQRSDPGRLYVFDNVKEVFKGKLYGSDGSCICNYYRLVDMSDELHDELWEVDKYDIYKKFEFDEVNGKVEE